MSKQRKRENILLYDILNSFKISINNKFRNNNNSNIRFSIRISSFSFFINFNNIDFETFIRHNISKKKLNDNNINRNLFNIRKLLIEKNIYSHFIDFTMINNFDLIVQIVIIVIINVVFNRFIKKIRQLQNRNNRRDVIRNSRNFSSHDNVDDKKRSFIRLIKNIDYFDSIIKNVENRFVINVNRYIFYRNVYVFETRLKKFVKKSFDDKIRELIFFVCEIMF